MREGSKYRKRVFGIILLGVAVWLILGILSRIGIFLFAYDFGFDLIVRRVYAVLGLTILILSVILSIMMTYAYRLNFPKLNEQLMKATIQYRELKWFRKIGFWIIMFGVLLQTVVFLLPFYIVVFTGILVYDFELLETIIAVIITVGVIMSLIPVKKASEQKFESHQKKELTFDEEDNGDKQEKTIKGFSRRTMFKIMLIAQYLMIAMAIFFNFRAILFTTDITKIFFYLTLQIISVPLYILFLVWVFKFRRKYFSMEPEERKVKYKKMWILVIITYLLFFGIIVYEFIIAEIIESMYGPYSLIQFLFELSFIFIFMFLCFGVVIAVLPKLKTD